MGLINRCLICGLFLIFLSVETSFALPLSDDSSPAERNFRFIYYLDNGIELLDKQEPQKADCYFQLALLYAKNNQERDKASTLRLKASVLDLSQSVSSGEYRKENLNAAAKQELIQKEIIKWENRFGIIKDQQYTSLMSQRTTSASDLPVISQRKAPISKEQNVLAQAVSSEDIKQIPVKTINVVKKQDDQPDLTMPLSEAVNSAETKRALKIEMGSFLILEGSNIQNTLVVDEGFLSTTIVDRDHLRIQALKRGTTFVHIWDDAGRRTIYVEVIFLKDTSPQIIKSTEVERGQPFRFNYASDWSTYYYGSNASNLKRQSMSLDQHFSLNGETPYGLLDTGLSANRFNGVSKLQTYTLGLTNIPLEGASNFNVRLFDSQRYLTPLTMPAIRLRGVFANIDLFDDRFGMSLDSGQKLSSFGFAVSGNSVDRKTYVDALKFTLFPKDKENKASFNYARGYGLEHENHLPKQVYSFDARRRLNEAITVTGEIARDSGHHVASLAGIRLKNRKGNVSSQLNFRDTSKHYTTVSGYPNSQGEIGAVWVNNINFNQNFNAYTTMDVYKDRLFFNADHPDALNLDSSAHVHIALNPRIQSETSLYYVYTPGEISPRKNLGVDEHLSTSLDIWGGRKLNIYGSQAYQRSRYEFSPSSEYDRISSMVGFRLPLTNRLSSFVNYEYSWIHETESKNDSNPNTLNSGLSYNTQINKKLSLSSQLTYRIERGVSGTNSFLAGEDSAGISLGLSYQPADDFNIFVDGQSRKVWSQVENGTSYADLSVHMGLRLAFDVIPGWDPRGAVAGYVFKDRDRSKTYNAGDEGIGGVKVKVGDQETETDAHGYYKVRIRAKSVEVSPSLDTLPSGYVLVTEDKVKMNLFQDHTSRVDFGVVGQTSVYGLVFIDKNEDGKPDHNEKFIKAVKIVFDKTTHEVTDMDGAYYFRDIEPGVHTIAVDINSLPMELIPNVSIENTIDVAEGSSYVFHVPLRIKEQR